MKIYIKRLIMSLYYFSFSIVLFVQYSQAKSQDSAKNSTDVSSQSGSAQSNITYIQQISNNPVIYAKNVANKITQNINKTLLSNNESISSNKSTLEAMQEKIQTEVTNLTNSISENTESIREKIKDEVSNLTNSISENKESITNALKDKISDIVPGVSENGSKIGEGYSNIVSDVVEKGGAFLGSVKEKISSVTDNLKNSIGENISNLLNSATSEEGINNITNTILNIVNDSINNGIGNSLTSTAAQIALNSGIQENVKDIISDKLNLLEQAGVSEDVISKLNENISSIIDGPMQKLSEGDFSGAASSLSETVSKLKDTVADTATNIIEEKKEVLKDTIIEKLGGEDSTLGSLASNIINDISDDVNITKIADEALNGDFAGAFNSIKESIGNLKETFSLPSLKEKASGFLSSLFGSKKDTAKDTITSAGNTIKSAIGNSTLGSTAIGKALMNIVDSGVSGMNEGAISAVNDILSSGTDEDRALAIEKLKNVGLDLKDTVVSSAIGILNNYKDTIIKTPDDIVQEVQEEDSTHTDNNSTSPSVSDSEKSIDEYVNKIQSEYEDVEKEVSHSEVEVADNIEHEYLNHEGNNVATAHHESSIHGAKTNSNSSENN